MALGALCARHPFVTLFVLNLVLRVGFVLETWDDPFLTGLVLDSRVFDAWAARIVAGDILGEGAFVLSPGYAYFLAFVYTIFGHHPEVVRILQHLLGCITALLLLRIASSKFGRETTWIVGLLYSLYPLFIFYESQLLMTSLAVFLMVLALHELVAGRAWTAGASLGLATLGRPNLLLADVFVAAWLVVHRRSPRAVAAFCAALVVTIAPVTARNYLVTGEAVLIGSHGGINFYLGNHQDATGGYRIPEHLPRDPMALDREARRLAQQDVGRVLSAGEVSRYWFGKGVESIVSQPLSYLALEARKLLLFLHDYEAPINANFQFYRKFSWVLSLLPMRYGVISAFAVLGMALGLRRGREHALFYGVLACHLGALLLFTMSSRYRLPVVPILILFGAAGVRWLMTTERKLVVGALAFACLVVFNCNIGIKPDLGSAYNNQANIYLRAGMPERATEIYRLALEEAPEDAQIWFNLGLSLEAQGRLREARDAHLRARSLEPDFAGLAARLRALERRLASETGRRDAGKAP